MHYRYDTAHAAHTHPYIFPTVLEALRRNVGQGTQLFEIGCGNGATAAALMRLGYGVTGVDPSTDGIAIANRAHPELALSLGSTNDGLASQYGTFDALISLEVIEHVFSPKVFAQQVRELLNPGGIAIVSTPYHGYLKNVALALTGRLDAHFTALWEGGHIKFWSRRTLSTLFASVGMIEVAFDRVGRVPQFAKSMVATYRRT